MKKLTRDEALSFIDTQPYQVGYDTLKEGSNNPPKEMLISRLPGDRLKSVIFIGAGYEYAQTHPLESKDDVIRVASEVSHYEDWSQ